ncbi:MAG: XrtA/PEP-CTERM system TPR-repeat protein PrsT, partial [Myxococcota bacterium]
YSLLLLERFDKIQDFEVPIETSRAVRFEWSMIKGRALLGAGRFEDANSLFESLRTQNPGNIGALLGIANAYFSQGDTVAAGNTVEQILALDEAVPSAWKIKGDLARLNGNNEQAIEFYDRTLAIDPGYFTALKNRALLLLERGDEEKALADIEKLREELPDDPGTILINSWLLARGQQDDEAQALLDDLAQTLERVDDSFVARNAQVQFAKGVTFYLQNRIDEALPLLNGFLERQPNHVGARLILAEIAVDRGQAGRLVRLLDPINDTLADRSELLSAYLEALVEEGDGAKAIALGEQFLEASPENQNLAQLLAVTYTEAGNLDKAVEVLMRGSKKQETAASGLLLGYLLLAQGKTATAVELCEQLLLDYPQSVEVSNFAGAAKLRSGDLAGAEALLIKTLQLSPTNLPALLNRAYLRVQQGREDDAKNEFLELAEQYPTDPQALEALSKMEAGAGNTPEAIKWTERLTRLQPANSVYQFRLARLYLVNGQSTETLSLVTKLERDFPLDERLIELKARAQLREQNYEQASRWLGYLYGSNNSNPDKIAKIAELQLQARDLEGATKSLKRLQALRPEDLSTQLLSARFELGAYENDKAVNRLQKLAKKYPQDTEVIDLLAEAYWRDRQIERFENAFDRAQELAPSETRLVKAAQRFWQLGQKNRATGLLRRWTQAHPDDLKTRELYAQLLIGTENSKAAYEVYLTLLSEGHALTVGGYNNLANLEFTRDRARAQEYAEEAYAMNPEDPAVIDTLAWIYVRRGKADKGLPLLRDASVRASRSPTVAFHLASALAALGRGDEARRIVTALLASEETFKERSEAEKLLASLE